MEDTEPRSLLRGHSKGKFHKYYIALSRNVDPNDPNIVIHNRPRDFINLCFQKLIKEQQP